MSFQCPLCPYIGKNSVAFRKHKSRYHCGQIKAKNGRPALTSEVIQERLKQAERLRNSAVAFFPKKPKEHLIIKLISQVIISILRCPNGLFYKKIEPRQPANWDNCREEYRTCWLEDWQKMKNCFISGMFIGHTIIETKSCFDFDKIRESNLSHISWVRCTCWCSVITSKIPRLVWNNFSHDEQDVIYNLQYANPNEPLLSKRVLKETKDIIFDLKNKIDSSFVLDLFNKLMVHDNFHYHVITAVPMGSRDSLQKSRSNLLSLEGKGKWGHTEKIRSLLHLVAVFYYISRQNSSCGLPTHFNQPLNILVPPPITFVKCLINSKEFWNDFKICWFCKDNNHNPLKCLNHGKYLAHMGFKIDFNEAMQYLLMHKWFISKAKYPVTKIESNFTYSTNIYVSDLTLDYLKDYGCSFLKIYYSDLNKNSFNPFITYEDEVLFLTFSDSFPSCSMRLLINGLIKIFGFNFNNARIVDFGLLNSPHIKTFSRIVAKQLKQIFGLSDAFKEKTVNLANTDYTDYFGCYNAPNMYE
jgi:hypothetical protein